MECPCNECLVRPICNPQSFKNKFPEYNKKLKHLGNCIQFIKWLDSNEIEERKINKEYNNWIIFVNEKIFPGVDKSYRRRI